MMLEEELKRLAAARNDLSESLALYVGSYDSMAMDSRARTAKFRLAAIEAARTLIDVLEG